MVKKVDGCRRYLPRRKINCGSFFSGGGDSLTSGEDIAAAAATCISSVTTKA